MKVIFGSHQNKRERNMDSRERQKQTGNNKFRKLLWTEALRRILKLVKYNKMPWFCVYFW